MKWNLKNFKNAPITSILAVLVLIVMLYSVVTGKATWQEAAFGLPIVVYLFGSNDPKIDSPGFTVMLLITCISFAVLLSCKRIPVFNTHTVETKFRDTTIYIKGDSVGKLIDNGDAIKAVLLAMKANGTKNPTYQAPTNNSNGFAKLTFKLDSLNRLYAQCDCKDSAFKATLKDIYDKQVKQVLVKKEVIPKWLIAIILLLGIVVILLLIKVLFK